MQRGVNYAATGFKPGYALQAAELNEIHEQNLVYQTLSNRSLYNWRVYDVNSIPYWDGTTPYDPANIVITTNGNQVTIKFSPSWFYLIDSTSTNSSNSGFGFWVNTIEEKTIIVTPPAAGATIRYGFNYEITTIGVDQDSSLKDESNSLIAGITVPGADRIQIKNISLVQRQGSFTKFSEIFAARRLTGSNTYALYWPYSNYSKKITTDIPV
jgi:hypothetical protein